MDLNISNTLTDMAKQIFDSEEESLKYCFSQLLKPSKMKGEEGKRMYNLFSNYRNRYNDPSKKLGTKARKRLLEYFGFEIKTTYILETKDSENK